MIEKEILLPAHTTNTGTVSSAGTQWNMFKPFPARAMVEVGISNTVFPLFVFTLKYGNR